MIQRTSKIDAHNRYMERGRASLARGFTAKAHQKDALDDCNRAFDAVSDMIGEALLSARDAKTMDDESKEWRNLYYSRPAAHVWNAKKAAPYAKHFPDLVKLADAAAALRAEVKAAPIVAKAPSKRQNQIAVEDAKRMNCQICGRPILAETGKIAHHGYSRPGTGWQTSSCYGALRLPYEVDRSAILELIPGALVREKNLIEYIAEVRAEKRPAVLKWTTTDRNIYPRREVEWRVEFTRETLPYALYFAPLAFDLNGRPNIHDDGTVYDYYTHANVPAFEYYLNKSLGMSELLLSQATDWRKYLERRRDQWKVTHKWTEDGWVKLAEAA